MNPSISDRIVSALSYFTCGIFSIVWIIFANVAGKPIGQYLSFNLYQAIFISVALAVISLIYSIAINLLSVVPFVGRLAKSFDLFFNQTPIYFTYTISGLIVSVLICYLAVFSLLGKKPYIPIVSDIIKANFG